MFLNRRLVQVDICGGVYFLHCEQIIERYIIFVLSSQTEAGSAGEQPVRDTLDGRRKCQFNGLSSR